MIIKTKIIVDTNIWISFLIGKILIKLQKVIDNSDIEIVITSAMISEIKESFERKHFNEYLKYEQFSSFGYYLAKLSLEITVVSLPQICRDEDDNYLLANL